VSGVELYRFEGQVVILGVSERQSNLPRTVPKRGWVCMCYVSEEVP